MPLSKLSNPACIQASTGLGITCQQFRIAITSFLLLALPATPLLWAHAVKGGKASNCCDLESSPLSIRRTLDRVVRLTLKAGRAIRDKHKKGGLYSPPSPKRQITVKLIARLRWYDNLHGGNILRRIKNAVIIPIFAFFL
ncbi:MAG: hypothetical protein KatS3mg087_0255 [Patescibacteria group bacterium]|nr:MAG: hypothetical protein KatS3mg087_0255 [Patescibacteria group bacterium]